MGKHWGNIWLIFHTHFHQYPLISTSSHFSVYRPKPSHQLGLHLFLQLSQILRVELEGNELNIGGSCIHGPRKLFINVYFLFWGNIWVLFTVSCANGEWVAFERVGAVEVLHGFEDFNLLFEEFDDAVLVGELVVFVFHLLFE